MPSVPGEHTGILREENIALRQILGYRLESLHPAPPYSPPPISHYIPGTHIKDVLLVAVDVDTGGGYEVISPGQSFHIGVSIFDTRRLTTQLRDPGAAITSHQFINTDSRPCKWAAKSFLFGDTERIALPEFTTRFAHLTAGRAYVLVAHGTREEVKFLNNLDPGIASRAAYIVDTVKAAQYPLQLYYRYSIEKLLDEFAIPYANLHAAGNDAHFALKALLMIAVRDGRMAPETAAANEELFRTLDAIAHAPVALPVWIEKPADPKPKKTKLGIKVKRRLKKARREARRIFPELPYCEDLNDDGSFSGMT
ncbi:QDE-2-interacting protein [Metarhizium acridum CQMa 102]|uniref:QDE-2-interacting protein n=1 Tax=Metarhizium acridum (strain CQMa 102) TaxID=655827 RepID=E9EC27_METAQ|nr:QDE-2-interacting protein [Metarhizium acridum CQMa 102]EFY86563.1 QDE-2-interacting protein [Metarhizium acridum CQMa 102]